MVSEGRCDCLVDSGQGHAGHAAVNIAQHAASNFEDRAWLLALDLQLCLGWRVRILYCLYFVYFFAVCTTTIV